VEGFQVKTSSNELEEPRWSRVVILSLLFHLIIFSIILFVPDAIPTRRISGATIYEVNLVEMPGKSRSIPPKRSNAKTSRKVTSSKKTTTAKRISKPSKEEKPVVIGKRVVKRKRKRKGR